MPAVYDDEKQGHDTSSDDLNRITGINKDEEKQMEDRANDSADLSRDDLKSAEESADSQGGTSADSEESDQLGKGYTGPTPKKQKSNGRNKKNKLLLFIIGMVVSAIAALVMLFMPVMRLESYMARINQRAFALAGQAVEARLGFLLERYMVTYMLNLESCRRERSIDCRANYAGQGLAANLFNNWRDVRIEAKLFDKYGIEVRTTESNGRIEHRIFDRRGNRVTATSEGLRSAISDNGRRQVGREMRQFLKTETRWYQVMERRSVRNYLERKHGMRLWCFFMCDTRDDIEDRKNNAKTRFRSLFVSRFVYPMSPRYAFILNCLASNANKCAQSGNDMEKESLNRRLSEDDRSQISTIIDENPDGRASRVFMQSLIQKVVRDEIIAKRAVGAVPVVGWVYAGISVVDAVDRVGEFVQNGGFSKMAAGINSAQYLEFYVGMRSANDEIKAGDLTMPEVRELVQQFEGAEHSEVFEAYNISSSNGTVSAASTSADEEYKCLNGEPIQPGDYVCEEKKIKRQYEVEQVMNDPVLSNVVRFSTGTYSPGDCSWDPEPCTIIRPILEGINFLSNAVLGPPLKAIFAAVKLIPGMSQLENLAANFFQSMAERVWPLPINEDSPGRERYDGLEAGADVAAHEFTKGGYDESGQPYGLGGVPLDEPEVTQIYEDYYAQQEYDYQNASLATKLTDLSYNHSFANQVLATMPTTIPEAPVSFIQTLSSTFANSFASIFSSPLSAQTASERQMTINAFGVTRYGYPMDAADITRDPADITEDTCDEDGEFRKEWEASRREEEGTGFDEYTRTNPCLLEMTAIEAGGALFTDD